MKLTILIFFFAITQMMAIETYSQGQGTLLSFSLNSVAIRDVLNEIENKSNFVFLYNRRFVDVEKTVSVDFKNQNINEILDELFNQTDIGYTVVDRQIVLINKNEKASLLSINNVQQLIKVSGIVTDSSGIPIPGVAVLLKGSTIGTVTDSEGKYTLSGIPDDGILSFSFVGMKRKDIMVDSQTTINVSLSEDAIGIEEVVAIGYGTVKKSDLTGSVSSVKGETLSKSTAGGVDMALQGRAAGVSITSNSGSPGSNTTIRIRGTGSIFSGNDPLFVMDGLPVGSDVINFINPADIENIEVLKDASSAAIYGSRGANGVILVTTKRGKSGAPKISFDSYYGVKSTPRNLKTNDAAQYAQVYLLGQKASGATINDINTDFRPYYSALDGIDFTKDYGAIQSNLYNLIKKDYPKSTDWWNEVIHKGIVQNYNVAINGGNESVRYASSVSYYDEEGMIKTSDFNRLTFRTNIDYTVNEKLKMGTNLTLVNTHQLTLNPTVDDFVIAWAVMYDPISPIYRSKEQTAIDGGDPDNPLDLYAPSLYTNSRNPTAWLARNNGGYESLRILGNAYLEYSILPELMFRSSIGVVAIRGTLNTFSPKHFLSNNDRNDINSITRSSNYSNSFNLTNQLTYSKKIWKHSVTGMAAIEASSDKNDTFKASAQNTPTNDEAYRYLVLATLNPQVGSTYGESSLISYIARGNYSYDDKYLATVTYRRDGSSKFASGHRWGDFKSFALGYRISEEEYFKKMNTSFIHNLKIRGGWGQLGNSSIPNYAYLSQYMLNTNITYPFGPSTYYTGGGVSGIQLPSFSQGIIPNVIGNPTIKWETQEQSNIGFDLGMFENKLTLTADYFVRTTKDNLIQEPIPAYVGYPSIPWSNNGKIENRGLEFTGDYQNEVGDFKYSIGANISFTKNKVISLGKGTEIAAGYTRISGNGTITKVGSSIADFIGFKTDGIFQTQEEVDNYKGSGGAILQPNAKPGDFRFVNTNNDNVLDNSDRQILGSPLPKFVYGFNVDLSYKNFNLNLLFQGQYGNKILVYDKYYTHSGQGYYSSVSDLPNIAWHGPGTSNSQPRIISSDPNLNFRMSDYFVEDASYMRLKNVQLAYNLPRSLSRFLRISSAKIYASGGNLLTFTKYSGLDPELATRSIWDMGISSFTYPQPKTYTVGLKIGF